MPDQMTPEEVAELVAELNAWFDETDAVRPSFE